MAGRRVCIYCGGTVSVNGYCKACGLGQSFLWKAGNTSHYYYNIALDRVGVRDLSGAIDSLKMSLRYNKSNTDARNLLGLIYYEMGETVSALGSWVISVNHKPKDNIAVRYLKDLRDNPETLNQATEIARTFNKGLELAQNHDFDLAIIQLRKCISMNPKFVKAYLLLSLISIAQKREGVAKKYISKVVAIDRTNPIALDFLREMGESDADINRLAEDGLGSEDDLFDYYGMEQEKKGKRPAKKIVPRAQEKTRSLRLRRYKEQNLARFSNIYMMAGIVIGLAVFYFLIAPSIRSNYNEKLREAETGYNKTISTKNSELTNLKKEVESLNSKNSDYESKESDMQETIKRLTNEVENLKKTVEAGGGSVDYQSAGDASQAEVKHNTNAAADRNNANVVGISGDSIEDMISNE